MRWIRSLRRPARRDLLLVVAVLVVAAVGYYVVRGSDPEDPYARYCAEVEDQRGAVGAARAAGPTTGLIRALPSFEALAEKAPQDIRDEWRIVVTRITDLRDALSGAGVDPSAYDPEKPPEGLDDAQLQTIRTAAIRLGSEETAAALTGVEQQARDVCKTPLSL